MRRVAKLAAFGLACFVAVASSGQNRKEMKFTAQPGATLSILNEFGPVTVRPGTGRQVQIVATPNSDQVEIQQTQSPNRVEVKSHYLQKGLSGDPAKVTYEVIAPADVAVSVKCSTGPVVISGMRGDVTAECDNAEMDVRDLNSGHVRLRSVSGPVKLTNVSNGRVDITSVGGPVTITNVSGPRVEVGTTSGKISYTGNFGNNGDYIFTNHNGDIDVTAPASPSVGISARSLKGSVENDFQGATSNLATRGFASQGDAGRAFTGTGNNSGSSVQIRSFSGKIRVKKQ